jgi:hypothetical protein
MVLAGRPLLFGENSPEGFALSIQDGVTVTVTTLPSEIVAVKVEHPGPTQ